MKKLLFFSLLSFNLLAQTPGAGVTDIDGNQYATVIIGTQEWMAENLRTSKYANGNTIPNVTDGSQWSNLTTGAWAHYLNNSQNEIPYGKLYNWYTVADPRNVCPGGWHVPTDAEFTILTDYLGGETVAGGKMKSTGTQYWLSPNTAATNESGFSGLPGGFRDGNWAFLGEGGVGEAGNWWSTTFPSQGVAWSRHLEYYSTPVLRYNYAKNRGLSIRCLKGAVAGIETLELPKKTLLKITDVLGRDTEFVPNTVQIYHYSDGTVEKVFSVE